MGLLDVVIPTRMIHSGQSVADVLDECVARNVPGVPFGDERDRITGHLSLRELLKEGYVPDYVRKSAELIGDAVRDTDIPEIGIPRFLHQTVDAFVLESYVTVASSSPVLKVAALMERFDSSYVFVVDNEVYHGVVTRIGIAGEMLRHQEG